MQTYARKPVMFVRGSGMRLYDDEGREYLDFVSGIGAVNLGHAHPAVTSALCEQAGKLVHVSNLFYVEHRAELARDVVELLGGGWKVFFANSGTEAIEGAIKLARRWARGAQARGVQGRLARAQLPRPHARGARGDRQASKQEAFAPMPEGFVHVPAQRHRGAERGGRRLGCSGAARGRAGRRRRLAAQRRVPRSCAQHLSTSARLPAHHRRDPDRLLSDGARFRASGVRHHAGRHHRGEGARQRTAHRRRSSRATGSRQRSQAR